LNEVHEVDIEGIEDPKYQYYEKATADRDTGDPDKIWINGDYFEVNPVPDTSRTMTCWYYQVPDRMSLDADTHLLPKEKETLLIDFARGVYDAREKDWNSVDRIRTIFYSKLNTWEQNEFEKEEDKKDMMDLEYEYKTEGRLIGL